MGRRSGSFPVWSRYPFFLCTDYVRRDPEGETLHQLVREHLCTFHAAMQHGFSGASLPGFVREDLQGARRL